MDLLADVDYVLASDRRFLLGNWVGDALQFAQTEEEIHLFNFNAKLQVSLWGDADTYELFDYANKFWAGMVQGYVQKKNSLRGPRVRVIERALSGECLRARHPIDLNTLESSVNTE